jgi:hypothetical protein
MLHGSGRIAMGDMPFSRARQTYGALIFDQGHRDRQRTNTVVATRVSNISARPPSANLGD